MSSISASDETRSNDDQLPTDLVQDSVRRKSKRTRHEVDVPLLPSTTFVPPQELSRVPLGYGAPWQWMQSGWMPPQHQQPPPWLMGGPSNSAPYPSTWDGSAHVMEGHLPNNASRDSRQRKHESHEAKDVDRSTIGMKPHQLRILASGEVDSACAGKNAWDDNVRTYTPRILDMSILEWEGQKLEAITLLRQTLEAEFEFVGHPMSMQVFRNAIKKYMRAERFRLKGKFMAGMIDCPIHVKEDQWEKLKVYWKTEMQQEKSAKMVNARAQVKNYNNAGRKGKAGKEVALMKEGNASITAAAVGTDQLDAGGPFATGEVASSIARIAALETKYQQLLLNQSETKEAIEEVKSMLMKGMTKSGDTGVLTSNLPTSAVEMHPNMNSEVPEVVRCHVQLTKNPTQSCQGESDTNGSYSGEAQEKIPKKVAKGGERVLQSQDTKDGELETKLEIDVMYLSGSTGSPKSTQEKSPHSTADDQHLVETTIQAKTSRKRGRQLQKGKSVCKPSNAAASKSLDGAINKDHPLNGSDKASLNKGSSAASKKKAPIRKSTRTLAKKIDNCPTASITEAAIALMEASGGARAKAPTSPSSASLTKKGPQPKSPLKVAAQDAQPLVQTSLVKKDKQTKVQPKKKPKTPKFSMDQKVMLLNPSEPKQAVASGVISGLWGEHKYHFEEIPTSWFKVDVQDAIWPHVSLMHPNLNADQTKLKHVVSSNTLWDGKYMKLIN